ncbi:hypothetical protein [Cupriavidus sp. H19C3]
MRGPERQRSDNNVAAMVRAMVLAMARFRLRERATRPACPTRAV